MVTGNLDTWEARCNADLEVQVLALHAHVAFLLRIGSDQALIMVETRQVRITDQIGLNESWDFTIHVPAAAWERFTRPAPAPQHTTLQAMLGRVEGVSLDGQRLKWAQHNALVERILALARTEEAARSSSDALSAKLLDDAEIVGRYVRVDVAGQPYRIYYESGGNGAIPLVFLHTAGSDSRQYKYLLVDDELKRQTTMYAFDLPWHGRSEPPADWVARKYDLTIDFYAEVINAFIAALKLDRPAILGCSMGGAIVLYLASRHGERYRACIAAEGGFGNPSRRVDWANHPMVNETRFMPSWVSGLIAPTTSPQLRSEILWEYSQAGPGVYHGDCYFYAFELPEIAKELGPATCPLYVLSGEYDYSATPAMSEHAAGQLGGKFILMEKMGHFPMSEEPERFARYVGAIVNELVHSRTGSP